VPRVVAEAMAVYSAVPARSNEASSSDGPTLADPVIVQMPRDAGSDDNVEDADSDLDVDEEIPASPTSTGSSRNKRKARRRRRHGKKAPSASTASTASGGNSLSEDESPKNRGVVTWRDMGLSLTFDDEAENSRVVTWRDLGLGMGPGGKKGKGGGKRAQPSNRPAAMKAAAAARCEMGSGPTGPFQMPSSVPDAKLSQGCGDASQRAVPPNLQMPRPQAAGQWLRVRESLSMPSSPQACPPIWGAQQWGTEVATLSVPVSPAGAGMSGSLPLAASSPMARSQCTMSGFASSCRPTASPAFSGLTQQNVARSAVPSWLCGSDLPITAEDLAERLRAVAPDAYED